MNTEYLYEFATKHNLVLETRGKVGFGRPCVGFTRRTQYIDINPAFADDFITEVFPRDERLYAPHGVPAYHKHDCLAVLVAYEGEEPTDDDFDRSLEHLERWVRWLQSFGEVYIEEYKTKARGLQVMMTGSVGAAVRIR